MDDAEQEISLLKERVLELEIALLHTTGNIEKMMEQFGTMTNILKMLTERVTGREVEIPPLRTGTG